jgi:hypothetical protein
MGAGDGVVVVVDDSVDAVDGGVDVADGGCRVVARGDMASLVGSLGGNGVRGVGWGLSLVCTAVSQVLTCFVDIPTSFSRRGSLSLGVICVTASVVVVWVLPSLQFVVSGSVWVSTSQRTAPRHNS